MFAAAGFLIVLISNLLVLVQGQPLCFASLEELHSADIAILLGTDNSASIQRRSDAARRVLDRKLVQKIIVTGNPQNGSKNEVEMITRYLEETGVPRDRIARDETGRNTLLSIRHARATLVGNRIIFVTDDYHSARTMFLARRAGLNAVCYTSASGWGTYALAKSHVREYIARVKAVVESYLLHKEVQ